MFIFFTLLYKTITNTTIVNTTLLIIADLKHLSKDTCIIAIRKIQSAISAINNTVKALPAAVSRIQNRALINNQVLTQCNLVFYVNFYVHVNGHSLM